ncbi:MAG: hypothetical protein H6R13_3702 [Proteobacteria bacterium]|nr:hypothetical protein [Pseudomonadota bacterium]
MTESGMPMKPNSSEQGFALLEVMIAILIFSFGLLGLVGLQANMIKQSTDARYRAVASYLAQQKLGEMWANPANVLTLLENSVDVSASLPAGTRSVAQTAPGQFTVTVRWQQPGLTQHVFTTTASIAGG